MKKDIYTRLSKQIKLYLFIILFLLAPAMVSAADLNLVLRLDQTGGVRGNLNAAGDVLNGIVICDGVNTLVGRLPGCDYGDDPLFDDNGTATDGSDDFYNGDTIVRTHDTVRYLADYNVNNGTDDVTLTLTAPLGMIWDNVPGFCLAGSSVNNDFIPAPNGAGDGTPVGAQSVMICTLGFQAAGSSSSLPFIAIVLDNIEGTMLDVTGEIDGPASAAITDAAGPFTVTATPRWNLRKALHYTPLELNGGTAGVDIRYNWYIEVWDDGRNAGDTADISALVGNAALDNTGTITFTDDVSGISANALLNLCDHQIYAAVAPTAHYNAASPGRSVMDSGTVACTQAGGAGNDITVTITGGDFTLNHVPTLTQNGLPLPINNRRIAALGRISIFIPNGDVTAAGTLATTNTLTDFDPDGFGGISNFNADSENITDNFVNHTLVADSGISISKFLRKTNDSILPHAITGHSGQGLIVVGNEIRSRVISETRAITTYTNFSYCDVWDKDKLELSVTPVTHHTTTYPGGFTTEYGTGYVSPVFPPADQTVSNSATHALECDTAQTGPIWYASHALALAANQGPVTKIRVTLDSDFGGRGFSETIETKIQYIVLDNPVGTIVPNYRNYSYDQRNGGAWQGSAYFYGVYPGFDNVNTQSGDRAIITSGFVRITKETGLGNSINAVTTGDTLPFVLKPTFTTSNAVVVTSNVTITDTLPVGLSYVAGTAFYGAVAMEPVITGIGTLGDPHVLTWDLGLQTANVALDDITFDTTVGVDFANGDVMSNVTVISSPADASGLGIRSSTRSVTVNVPATLLISKSVGIPQIESGEQIDFTVTYRNGNSTDFTALDFIDVLPFNTDNSIGIPFTGFTHNRLPATDYNGTLVFNSVSATTATATWYFSNANPTTINLAPSDVTNNLPTALWCLGTAAGPAGACGFTNADVTAFRLIDGAALISGSTRTITVTLDTNNNIAEDIYTNNAGGYASELVLPVLSNDVSVVVVSSTIGDFVWSDLNGDGVQDIGEPGIPGLTVTLGGDANATVITANGTTDDLDGDGFIDPAGFYIFMGLNSGNYTVTVTPPANTTQTFDEDGTGTAHTSPVVLGVNTDYPTADFGYQPNTASIGDFVWNDLNGDGVQDGGAEVGFVGVTVDLYLDVNGDGVIDGGDTLIDTQTTIAGGAYDFTSLAAGDYIVDVTDTANVLIGYNLTTANDPTAITLSAGQDYNDADFGYIQQVDASIGDFVWNDLNGDGVQDGGAEVGIVGVTVDLYLDVNGDGLIDGGDTLVGTQTTIVGGAYDFTSLAAGDYIVDVTDTANVLTGYNITTANDPTSVISIIAGQDYNDADFGYQEPGSISGNVSTDEGNGIENVIINLLDSSGQPVLDDNSNPITTTTDTDGNYIFVNIPPGEYQIEQIQPLGYETVSDTEGNPYDNIIFSVIVTPGNENGNNNFVESFIAIVIPIINSFGLLLLTLMLMLLGTRFIREPNA